MSLLGAFDEYFRSVFSCLYNVFTLSSLQMSVTLTYIFILPKRMLFLLFLYLPYTELRSVVKFTLVSWNQTLISQLQIIEATRDRVQLHARPLMGRLNLPVKV